MLEAYSVLILPDVHVPYHDKRAIDAVLDFATDESWDEIVQLGDFLDIDPVSSHNKGKPGNNEGKRLIDEFSQGKDLLDQISAAVFRRNSECKRTILEGNHEHRVNRFLQEQPALEGLIEVEHGLELESKGWNYVRAHSKGDSHVINGTHLIHGISASDAHAKRTAISWGANVIYGHTHCVQSYSHKMRGNNRTVIARSIGCLCRLRPAYLHCQPDKWSHAFAVMHINTRHRITVTVCEIENGRFAAPNGRIYGAKKKK